MLSVRDVAEGAAALTGDPDQPALAVVDLDHFSAATADDVAAAARLLACPSVATVGRATRPLPPASEPFLAALTCTLAPDGPGRSWVAGGDGALERIEQTVAASPRAALTLANLLPATARCGVYDALQLESLAYSTLLAGPEFTAWRQGTPAGQPSSAHEPVLVERVGDRLLITLNRPERHNAFGRAVRDGLLDALRIAELDDAVTEVVLRGAGRSFCSGGDLDEFGTAADPAAAHVVRLARSAGAAVHRLRDRVRAEVHGACVGAGIEVPSFASRVVAAPDTWFLLPELSMGLVPGAGGTVSITRRIGRWRTAYLALTGARVDAATALGWGLVDEVV